MNNYTKILIHLRTFAGDSKLHNIDDFLTNIGLTTQKEKQTILSELSKSEFINFDGGRKGGQIIIGNKHSYKTFGEFYDKPFEAKITIEGLKHLKDELYMENKGAYNIEVSGNNNQIIIESKNIKIEIKNEIDKIIENIIKTIEDSNLNSDIKINNQTLFRKLGNEIQEDNCQQSTLREAISIGDSLSSIGSMIISIINLLNPIS